MTRLHWVTPYTCDLYFYAGVRGARITTELYYTRQQADSVTQDPVRVIRIRRRT